MNDRTASTPARRAPDGSRQARVVGSIVEHLFAPDDPEAVLDRMADPATRIVSLTITEGGYIIDRDDVSGEFDAADAATPADLPRATRRPRSGYSSRRCAAAARPGTAPFTVLSCDNVQGNGEVARRAVVARSPRRLDPGARPRGSPTRSPSPTRWSTGSPRATTDETATRSPPAGVDDGWPVRCEPFTQWVVEDRFPAGRPALEEVGVQLVDDVDAVRADEAPAAQRGPPGAGLPAGCSPVRRTSTRSCRDPHVRRLAAGLHRGGRPHPAGRARRRPGRVLRHRRGAVRQPADLRHHRPAATSSSTGCPPTCCPWSASCSTAARRPPPRSRWWRCWARFLEGVDDQGRAYRVDDLRAADLQARAGRHDDDLLAVVRDNPLFEGLAGRAEFEQPYAATLALLRGRGTRAALDALIAGPPAPPPEPTLE